jgi:hypothetical protein
LSLQGKNDHFLHFSALKYIILRATTEGMNMNAGRNRFLLVICLALGLMFESAEADTDQATEQRIDAAVERAMTQFQVPGMTVAVVNKGEVVYSKGHGVREIGNEDAVDRDTPSRPCCPGKTWRFL